MHILQPQLIWKNYVIFYDCGGISNQRSKSLIGKSPILSYAMENLVEYLFSMSMWTSHTYTCRISLWYSSVFYTTFPTSRFILIKKLQ